MASQLNSEALEFFRKAGKAGGKKRADNMTKKERSELASKASKARWSKKKPKQ
jgi:hypothetical protein